MDWDGWIGKKVFIRTRNGRVFSGTITEIDNKNPLVFLTLIDRFNKSVMLVQSEIIELKEEH